MNRNYGGLLERSVRRSGFGISKLSRILKVSRPTLYKWFRQEDLDILTIVKIEKIMGINPDEVVAERYGLSPLSLSGEEGKDLQAGCRLDEGAGEVRYWMERYISLLEKYNRLLERKKNAVRPRAIEKTMVLHKATNMDHLYR